MCDRAYVRVCVCLCVCVCVCVCVWCTGGVVSCGGLRTLAEACSHPELRLAQVAVSAMANLAIGKTKDDVRPCGGV